MAYVWKIADVEPNPIDPGQVIVVAVFEPDRDAPLRVEYRESVAIGDITPQWGVGFTSRAIAHRQAQHGRFPGAIARIQQLENYLNSEDPATA